jgi:GTPase
VIGKFNANHQPQKALSDFADYVQKQQAKRKPASVTPQPVIEDHDELDIIDQLGLAEETHTIRLKQVLLDNNPDTRDNSVKQFKEYAIGRLDEGNGEYMFDLGLEDNGDSMGFARKDWDFALERVISCAEDVGADCRVLMTRNVEGSEIEVGPREGGKDTSCSGKLMVRRRPKNVDDVIETRIAVVGNGSWFSTQKRLGIY